VLKQCVDELARSGAVRVDGETLLAA
jgi:hypothetical protein